MALVIRSIYNYYHYFFHEYEDPRIKQFPLVHSPIPVLSVIVLYLLIVLKWGPEYMKDRKPYDLRNVMKVYNIFQVVFNLGIGSYGLWNSYLQSEFSLTCQLTDVTNTKPYMRNLILASYFYYIIKFVDLLDTIFFVLRKKNSQISFLHVYHHAGILFAAYCHIKFLAGSHPTMIGVINAQVHVVMYSYYFLSSLGNNSIKYAWCKKYITQIQLTQFGMLIIHFTIPILKSDCEHPKFIAITGLIQNAFMFVLFFDFYIKAYLKKKK